MALGNRLGGFTAKRYGGEHFRRSRHRGFPSLMSDERMGPTGEVTLQFRREESLVD